MSLECFWILKPGGGGKEGRGGIVWLGGVREGLSLGGGEAAGVGPVRGGRSGTVRNEWLTLARWCSPTGRNWNPF